MTSKSLRHKIGLYQKTTLHVLNYKKGSASKWRGILKLLFMEVLLLFMEVLLLYMEVHFLIYHSFLWSRGFC